MEKNQKIVLKESDFEAILIFTIVVVLVSFFILLVALKAVGLLFASPLAFIFLYGYWLDAKRRAARMSDYDDEEASKGEGSGGGPKNIKGRDEMMEQKLNRDMVSL